MNSLAEPFAFFLNTFASTNHVVFSKVQRRNLQRTAHVRQKLKHVNIVKANVFYVFKVFHLAIAIRQITLTLTGVILYVTSELCHFAFRNFQ